MSLANRLRELREARGLSLEELATKASVSKTYLWELEKDTTEMKKPSADVLVRIANALSTTIADIMSLPAVRFGKDEVLIPPSLREFADRMKSMKAPLTDSDLRDLAMTKFRGGQPRTADGWHALYLLLDSSARKRQK